MRYCQIYMPIQSPSQLMNVCTLFLLLILYCPKITSLYKLIENDYDLVHALLEVEGVSSEISP